MTITKNANVIEITTIELAKNYSDNCFDILYDYIKGDPTWLQEKNEDNLSTVGDMFHTVSSIIKFDKNLIFELFIDTPNALISDLEKLANGERFIIRVKNTDDSDFLLIDSKQIL